MFGLNGLKTLSAAFVVAAASWAGTAQAVPVTPPVTYTGCIGTGYDLSDNVEGAVDCEISSASQDFLNTDPITVNAGGGFFDIETWVFEGKIGVGDLADAGASGGIEGSFDLTDFFAGMIGEALLVFKSGEGTSLVGYLFDLDGTTDLSLAWTTPFQCPPFTGNNGCKGFPKAVSHISVYSNAVPAVVPVPAAGLLLIGALGALGLAKRRRAA